MSAQSRYIIDLNRDPEGRPLYPGADNTERCPSGTFASEAIYRGACPDTAEIARRRAAYWQPYHDALSGELKSGRVILWEAHSISSEVPRLFEGRLPAPPWSACSFTGGPSPRAVAKTRSVCAGVKPISSRKASTASASPSAARVGSIPVHTAST